jgi:uncharacterized protein HemX
VEPVIPDVLAAGGTDLATVAVLILAVLGFAYTLYSGRRTSSSNYEGEQSDRITDLLRQRDEAKADLANCEQMNRALERAIAHLENGGNN